MRDSKAAAMLAIVIAFGSLAGFAMPAFSSAAFTSTSKNPGNTVGAAADWTPPTVTMQDPGSPVRDTVTVSALASDAESGIQQVTLQYQPAGSGTWTTLCTATAAPFSCSWNTKLVGDGPYDLRAIALDNSGYSATSASIRTQVANALAVSLADPGEVVRGTITLATTLTGAGSTPYTVRVEYAPTGTTTWKSICTNLASPYNCTWNTTTFNNEAYDLRSAAVSGSSTTYSPIILDVLVDNALPAVTMTDPGTPLSGTRTFAATATDAHSGVASVTIQYAVSGSNTYQNLCTITAPPYSCRYDTTALANATYSFRAIATDVAGNVNTSAAVNNRVVDNTVSSVSMEDPGAYLSGTVNLTANAASTAGVSSVRIQYAPAGTTTWTTLCTFTAGPYTCTWNTSVAKDGLYDFRAVLIDGLARETVSTTVPNRRIDNSPLRGADIQTANGGATAGKMEAGDVMVYTYSEQINLATVTPGWTGAALPVTLRVRDGNLLNLGNTGDTVDILRSGAAVNLGTVNLKQDYIKSGKTATFNATMTGGTVTVNGVIRTTVTITLGTLASGDGLRTVSTTANMVWTPSTAVTDLFGNPGSAAPATETGVLDREF